ncbi:MAG TPA: class IIb bacteriocin, lactobin A/cerein 7B family [Hyphomicrobiaceae bacterium]|jgi:lactobin A/cerein 7B family class IIb bacteriocin
MTVVESLDRRDAAGTETLSLPTEIRALNDAELDAVNGGIIPVLIGIGLFAGGFTVGCILANYKMTGNFWGDI